MVLSKGGEGSRATKNSTLSMEKWWLRIIIIDKGGGEELFRKKEPSFDNETKRDYSAASIACGESLAASKS